MDITLRPLHNKVIIERKAAEKTSAGGIILQSTDEADKAIVLATGPDVKEVSVGDSILLNWNAATKQGSLYVVSEDNIVLVFEE